jgi:hypothetical protein
MSLKQLSDGGPQGTVLGQSSTDLVSFYGATPVVRPAAVTTLATTPTATDIATAVNTIIARLVTLGLTA